MNAQNATQYLPLVQALANGKTIQVHKIVTDEWIDLNEMEFSLEPEKYRVKPEPVELWLCRTDYTDWAECKAGSSCTNKLRVHVREIV